MMIMIPKITELPASAASLSRILWSRYLASSSFSSGLRPGKLHIRDKMFSKSISSIEIPYMSRLIRNDHLVRWRGQSHGGQPLVAGLPTYNRYWFLWVCGMLFWITSSYSPIFGRGCKKSREVCLKFSLWKVFFNMETQYSDKKSRVWLHWTFVKIWITKASTSTRRAQIQPNQKQWCCFYHGWEQGKKSGIHLVS